MELSQDANLSDLFLARVRETPNARAYRQFNGAEWIDLTWEQVAREVGRWRAALAREGLEPGTRVAMCLRNSVEWVLFDQAAIGLGLVTVPLYFGDRPDNMAFCLNDSGANLLVLETADPWSALRPLAKTLKRVVCLRSGPASSDDDTLVGLSEWLPAQGETPSRSTAAPNDLATIVYTSGTTGRPKGVMLSHRNIVSNVVVSARALPLRTDERTLSFLPLSHVLERTAGYYLVLYIGAQTVFARSISLLGEDLRQQQPTLLIAVPRIFERIYNGMSETMPPGSLKRRLFEATVDVGWRRFIGTARWRDNLLWPLLYRLVGRKVHAMLGGRLRVVISGGAPLAPQLSHVFIGLGLPILQGYGLTETAPVLTVNRLHDNDPASVGRALEGVELRCDENGELLARGPNVMLGYWNNPEATAATIDADGWLRTGDLARIRDGRVYITGRVKDIIVLSNGEKVSPSDAEQAILMDAVFEQVMVIGEGRAKLGLLAVSRWEDEAALCERANRQLHDFPGYAKICHLARIAEPWTVESGLLTPTMKLKRTVIETRFRAEVERMYAREDLCGC